MQNSERSNWLSIQTLRDRFPSSQFVQSRNSSKTPRIPCNSRVGRNAKLGGIVHLSRPSDFFLKTSLSGISVCYFICTWVVMQKSEGSSTCHGPSIFVLTSHQVFLQNEGKTHPPGEGPRRKGPLVFLLGAYIQQKKNIFPKVATQNFLQSHLIFPSKRWG